MSYQDILTDDQVKFTDDLWGVDDFLSACEVKEVPVTEWLKATVGMHMDVKHVRGEKVVALRAAPEEWSMA
jgi:hypothetical protein